jgi:hypothetical protein
MGLTVFYSWQVDRPSRECRNFIEAALEEAVKRIARDVSVVEAERNELSVDKDTRGVPGSPPIFDTILGKIERSAVFVADLTYCGTRANGRPTPNPNVLIEYGWALKTVGLSRMLAVMNTVYGKPDAQSLPFDLAHLRFPIGFELLENADAALRSEKGKELSKTLERAIREVLDSDAFKAFLPIKQDPPLFSERKPLYGKSRFRLHGEALGFSDNFVDPYVPNSSPKELHLVDGPATWMRIMPKYGPARSWSAQELREQAFALAYTPLLQNSTGAGFVRGEDGYGVYPATPDDEIHSVCYVFESGEIWIVNTWLNRIPHVLGFDEDLFGGTLEQGAALLQRLEYRRPYRWIVGIDGAKGCYLELRALSRRFGPCVTDVVEGEGTLNEGESAANALEPFYEKVFELCGTKWAAKRS